MKKLTLKGSWAAEISRLSCHISLKSTSLNRCEPNQILQNQSASFGGKEAGLQPGFSHDRIMKRLQAHKQRWTQTLEKRQILKKSDWQPQNMSIYSVHLHAH